MSTLTIIRGLPGSGKTTLARKMIERGEATMHVEADMWFTVKGEYRFDPSRLKDAHRACQELTKNALDAGHTVVVSNTFTQAWEMRPYFEMGYPVNVIEATGEWENIHGVPHEKIEAMRARWENFDPALFMMEKGT